MGSRSVRVIMRKLLYFQLSFFFVWTALLATFPAFAQQEQVAATSSNTASQLDLKPDANGNLSQEQMRRLLRIAADKDIENDKHLRDYTYVEREEEHRLDGKEQVKSTEVKTYDVMEIYGEPTERLIEK